MGEAVGIDLGAAVSAVVRRRGDEAGPRVAVATSALAPVGEVEAALRNLATQVAGDEARGDVRAGAMLDTGVGRDWGRSAIRAAPAPNADQVKRNARALWLKAPPREMDYRSAAVD